MPKKGGYLIITQQKELPNFPSLLPTNFFGNIQPNSAQKPDQDQSQPPIYTQEIIYIKKHSYTKRRKGGIQS